MSAGLKSESGGDALNFLGGALYLLVGLVLGCAAIQFVGIDIPLSDSPNIRLLQIVFFGAIGCAALHLVAGLGIAFLQKLGILLLTGLMIAMEAGEQAGAKLADLSVLALRKLALLAIMPVIWPVQQFNAYVLAPWREGRRQEAELRRTYEDVKDQFGSYEDFRAAFDGREAGDAGAQDDVRTEEQAAPDPVDEFAAACEVLGLAADGAFTQAVFKARYRKLMKESHPDITGDAATATKLNEARDLIKSRKGWK
jgi:hypothetical protein